MSTTGRSAASDTSGGADDDDEDEEEGNGEGREEELPVLASANPAGGALPTLGEDSSLSALAAALLQVPATQQSLGNLSSTLGLLGAANPTFATTVLPDPVAYQALTQELVGQQQLQLLRQQQTQALLLSRTHPNVAPLPLSSAPLGELHALAEAQSASGQAPFGPVLGPDLSAQTLAGLTSFGQSTQVGGFVQPGQAPTPLAFVDPAVQSLLLAGGVGPPIIPLAPASALQLQQMSVLASIAETQAALARTSAGIASSLSSPLEASATGGVATALDPRFQGIQEAAATVSTSTGTPQPSVNVAPVAAPASSARPTRAINQEAFPEKLHRMLMEVEEADKDDIVSFNAEGNAFEIHRPDAFEEEIIGNYFRHNRLASFRRQLSQVSTWHE